LLVNGNPNSVSGTLSIATYSISTISSTSYVTETTTQLVNTVQIVTAGSSILSSGAPSSLLLIGALAAVAIVGFVFYRRRSAASGTSQGAEAMRPLPHPAVKKEPSPLAAPPPPSAVVVQPSGEQPPVVGQRASLISTGYPELDQILSGGLPERYAILFASPSYDERDLLLRKIIESNSLSGNPSFYVSGDMRKLEDLSGKYHNNFFALCSQAGKLTSEYVNLFNLPTLENLSEFNISLTHMLRGIPVRQGARKIMIIDFLSDVLLHHKLPTTRRWLSDFLTRRKADGFTVLATFNPLIAAREEVQTIMDSFDGVIEIYEKELKERSRRFLTIKKMYGLRYSESELMLDKDELY
jgi:KaiC/GvpD/RAD55 family RecA-like ATPase